LSFTEHNPESPKQFLRYAGLCVEAAKHSFGIDLQYDLASIKKLDEVIDGIGKPKNPEQMIMIFGSYLGEAFRQLYNGSWTWDDHFKTWGVTFPLPKGSKDTALVFFKVQKRFNNGMEDSLSFFAVVTDGKANGRIP
jgi:hypothetical protein